MEERIASEQRWSTLLRRTLISGLVFTANYALLRTGLSPVNGILSGINEMLSQPLQYNLKELWKLLMHYQIFSCKTMSKTK
jgi:hypothetical protein